MSFDIICKGLGALVELGQAAARNALLIYSGTILGIVVAVLVTW